MTRREHCVWGIIMLTLLYISAVIAFSIEDWRTKEAMRKPICSNEVGRIIPCPEPK